MSARGTRWQRFGQVLVGLATGVICLVMWGGSASAVDAPPATPPPPSLASGLDDLLGQTTVTLDELLDPLGVGVAPVVDPLADQILVPSVGSVEASLAGLTPPLTPVPAPPTLPELPGLPPLPETPVAVTGPPAAAPVAALAGALAGIGAIDADVATAGPTPGSTISERPGPAHSAMASPGHELIESASVEGGSSSDPAFPTPAPLVEAALGTLASTSTSASTGLVLLAVLAGFAAVAANPRWRRLALGGPLSPRALAYAIATPPG